MANWAVEHWQRFRAEPGSERIATPFAIAGLDWWLRRCTPREALELGGGLGTLTAVLLDCVPQVTTVELEAEFRLLLWRRFGLDRFEMHGTFPRGPRTWDFLVVDDNRFNLNPDWISAGGTVFFEGGHRDRIAGLLAGHRRYTLCTWRPWDRSKGYTVVRFEPTGVERVWFALSRVIQRVLDFGGRLFGIAPGKRRAT